MAKEDKVIKVKVTNIDPIADGFASYIKFGIYFCIFMTVIPAFFYYLPKILTWLIVALIFLSPFILLYLIYKAFKKFNS